MVCRYDVKPVYFCDDSQLFDTIDTKEKIWSGCMVWMRGVIQKPQWRAETFECPHLFIYKCYKINE